ncbi:putative membrane protein [Jannaschia seosinensis]|uniref:Protoporphyrinogen IX oxidase n=1 Tax=Jannaschia seosinensis TaxID=313367 RepID=A0A0M7B9K8_9RHOB|nr:CopD family protein [Jannaschia seosinensis]CUH39410.1 putative membrane protein [Jannaschia seosinensis]
MVDWYLWLKAGHVISFVAWMAALFYLPRLFVYHVEQRGSVPEAMPMLEVMERRLLRAIMTPAMIATWFFGMGLIGLGVVDWSAVWPWTKAAAVLAMTAFHMWCAAERKRLSTGRSTMTGRGFRIANEFPTLLLIVIVISVIVRPA